ncbi:MAG: hypothetical protein GY798_01990 [Hyphomicrobiales bacterium]|nr:hypothetical protein [Hyphomicrobiales bacterium]
MLREKARVGWVIMGTQSWRDAMQATKDLTSEELAGSGVQRLIEERKNLFADLEACRNKIAGLDIAIQLLTNGSLVESASTAPARQVGVTEVLVSLLEEAGSEGLSAKELTKRAGQRGRPVKRQSVSSLLSRLKREGTLVYENNRYKLPEGDSFEAPGNLADVHTIAA